MGLRYPLLPLCLLLVLLFKLAAWSSVPPCSSPSLARHYYLATAFKAQKEPFDVLYFYDDSTFVALRSSGLVAQGDSLLLYPELGYLLFRGRVRARAKTYCCSYSIIKRMIRVIGEELPHQESALPSRLRPNGQLQVAGVTFRPVPRTTLSLRVRQYLAHSAQRQDQTQYRFDCQ